MLAFLSRLYGGGNSSSSSVDAQVDILAFEVARAMSRLVTLRTALTPSSVELLQSTTIPSAGVKHLNASDSLFLLRVACAEMLDDLDRTASTISRLASRSLSPWPRGFDQVYADLKSGSANFDRKLVFPKKILDKKLKKMEAFVSSTSTLYAEMETLAEMEASERKLERWKNYSGPMTTGSNLHHIPPGADAFLKKLAVQKKVVQKSKEESLWVQSKVKISELMARTAVTVFVRICEVFNKFVPELPVVDTSNGKCRSVPNPLHVRVHPKHLSGPLDRRYFGDGASPPSIMKFSGPIMTSADAMTPLKTDLTKWTARMLEPAAGTLGAAGLALRYADLIQMAERMFHSPEYRGEEDREEIYQMLPGSLRAAIRTKLKGAMSGANGAADRNSRRAAAEKVLEWLAPIANDTSNWFSDRSCERQRIDPTQKVLMLQTLQISDQKKAEAAIVDVLVGLSFAYQCPRGWER